MLLTLPNELLMEVISFLQPDDAEELRGLLSLRRTCQRLEPIATSHLKDKMNVRVGITKTDCGDRVAFFKNLACTNGFKAWFSGVTIDFAGLEAAGESTDDGPAADPGKQRMKTVDFMYAITTLLQDISPSLSRFELICPGELEDHSDSAWEPCDEYGTATAMVIRYAIENRRLPRFESLRVVADDSDDLRDFMEVLIDPQLSLECGCDGECNEVDPNEYLEGQFGGDDVETIPLFAQIYSMTLSRYDSKQDGMKGFWISDPDSGKHAVLLEMMPAERRVEYESSASKEDLEAALEAAVPPNQEVFKLRNLELPDPDSIDLGGSLTSTLRELELVNCRMPTRDLRDDWSQEGLANISNSTPIALLLDVLLVSFGGLERLVIEGLGYIRPESVTHREDLIIESEYSVSTEKVPIPAGSLPLTAIANAPYQRPVVTPFRSDLDALLILRTTYSARRRERGLPVDAWTQFLHSYESQITRCMTFQELDGWNQG